jgi:hypothetical protein
LESNFNNNAPPDPSDPTTVPDDAGTPEPATTETPLSAALVRFRSCRWMQPAEDGHSTEFCTHREVKPYAGTTAFDASAWCPDCVHFKLRRVPKKRSPDDYSY